MLSAREVIFLLGQLTELPGYFKSAVPPRGWEAQIFLRKRKPAISNLVSCHLIDS
jgi:hypothetical protein